MNNLNKKKKIYLGDDFKSSKLNANNKPTFVKGYSSSSFTNILFTKDKDKINIENTTLFYKFNKLLFNKKVFDKKIKFDINLKNNIINKDNSIGSINLFNNYELFKNKLIRQSNKIQSMQINVNEQEISMNNLLNAKKYKYFNNIVIDGNNKNFDKNKIFNLLKIQTKSNFNNKYNLLFKSSNIKKRKIIQNYFSMIKKRDIGNCQNTSFLSNMNCEVKPNSCNNKKLNKKISGYFNVKFNEKTKRKKPLYKPNNIDKKKIEFMRIKSTNNINSMSYQSYNSNISKEKDNTENNDCFSFFSTKNPVFQTEIASKNKKNKKNK